MYRIRNAYAGENKLLKKPFNRIIVCVKTSACNFSNSHDLLTEQIQCCKNKRYLQQAKPLLIYRIHMTFIPKTRA